MINLLKTMIYDQSTEAEYFINAIRLVDEQPTGEQVSYTMDIIPYDDDTTIFYNVPIMIDGDTIYMPAIESLIGECATYDFLNQQDRTEIFECEYNVKNDVLYCPSSDTAPVNKTLVTISNGKGKEIKCTTIDGIIDKLQGLKNSEQEQGKDPIVISGCIFL